MNKVIIFLFLELLLFQVAITQNTWQRHESSSKLEVGDVAITSRDEYFISLKNNHHVFHSKDSGTTWQEVLINNGNSKFYHTIDRSYLKVIDNKVYCVSCAGSSKRYIYNAEIFEVLPKYTNTPSENLIINQEGQVFFKDELYINRTDSSWNRIFDNKFIFKYENDYGIISTNFYTENNNFVNTYNYLADSSIIYKVKTDNSNNVSIYSKFKVSRGLELELTSKGGTTYFMVNNGGVRVFNYISNVEQNKIQKSKLQSIFNVKVIYYYYVNSKAEIFLITDKGVFMNEGIEEDLWIKCQQMSDQLPFPTSSINVNFYKKYFIKDSLNALISYGDNCGQSDYYCFTPKFKKWKSIQLNVNIDNLTNLVKNKNNQLFAYRPCEMYFGRSYLKSNNQGKDWETIFINGEYVTSIGINNEGEALAVATNNKMYKQNLINDNWQEIQSPVDPKGNIKLFHIYSNKNELFLSGNTDRGSSKEKNYLYHSGDGGLNWTEIKAFVKNSYHPLNDFEILIDRNNDWIVYQTQSQWIPNEVLISKDRGKTWNSDARFRNFYPVVSISQLPDNRYLISGDWNYSKLATYVVDSVGNFEIYKTYYDKNPAKFFHDNDNKVFGYTTYTYTDIPFYSKDLGLNVIQDESGLMSTDIERRLIHSAVYERSEKITLNLAYDGIYTTTHDIFLNLTDDSNLSELYSVFQNNDWILIEKKDQSSWNNHENLQVYNVLGQVIELVDLESTNGKISTRQLTQGVYLMQVKNGNTRTQTVKFIVR